jgi:hypothetical protein
MCDKSEKNGCPVKVRLPFAYSAGVHKIIFSIDYDGNVTPHQIPVEFRGEGGAGNKSFFLQVAPDIADYE